MRLFRVSEEKFEISFLRRFFFLWLRFFLFARNKKKEMNKIPGQSILVATPKKTLRSAKYDLHPPKTFRFAQSDRECFSFKERQVIYRNFSSFYMQEHSPGCSQISSHI